MNPYLREPFERGICRRESPGWLNTDDAEATAVLQSEKLTREDLERAFVAMGWDSTTAKFRGNEFVEWYVDCVVLPVLYLKFGP